jgi:hypothetical protein
VNAVKVTTIDHGLKRARQLLKQPRKILRIGVLESEAAQPHPSRDGVTIGQVARWQEYGAGMGPGATPARSWLWGWFWEHYDLIYRQLAADTYRVIFAGENEALALMKRGGVYRDQIEDRIRYENVFASNAPSTIKKKGFDLPLIDTETFVESIQYEVK